jgi:hypothetical protein
MLIIDAANSAPANHIGCGSQWRTPPLWDQLCRAAQRTGYSSVTSNQLDLRKIIVPLTFHSTSPPKRALLSVLTASSLVAAPPGLQRRACGGAGTATGAMWMWRERGHGHQANQ